MAKGDVDGTGSMRTDAIIDVGTLGGLRDMEYESEWLSENPKCELVIWCLSCCYDQGLPELEAEMNYPMMKYTKRERELSVAIILSVVLSGVIFGHLSFWWLLLPVAVAAYVNLHDTHEAQ